MLNELKPITADELAKSTKTKVEIALDELIKQATEEKDKRIAELIALINAERKRQEQCDDIHLRKIAELEKENAELKGIKDVATLIRANNDTVITLMQLNNKLVSKSQQLTKAKEIIKRILPYTTLTSDEETDYYLRKYYKEAEDFIRGE